jgi:hypothetical protein
MIMEQLLHYCWKHRLMSMGNMHTTDGKEVEVIDPGLHNRNAGPDFFNAKVKIDGTMWVGNVEIHSCSSHWYAHGHDKDRAYDNVVLHVVDNADAEVMSTTGKIIPQVVMSVPQKVADNYQELLRTDSYPPCYKIVPELSKLTVHSWMSALQTERLEQKTVAIEQRVRQCGGAWEDAYFVTLARNYGFGINGDAFEQWAQCVPLSAVGKHRDNLFQVEAMFMGQAGLLDINAVPERNRNEAAADDYFKKLSSEYKYLAHKFSLTPMDYKMWRFLRLRPQNFPHIRISQLATLYNERRTNLSMLAGCETIDQLRDMFKTHVSPYWETHYTFGSESGRNAKHLSPFSINLLIINTAVPMLFAYGRHLHNETLCDRAFDFLEQLKAENNNIIRMWQECGLEVRTAGDSQALIQLKKEYCDRRECLRCRIGYEYLRVEER